MAVFNATHRQTNERTDWERLNILRIYVCSVYCCEPGVTALLCMVPVWCDAWLCPLHIVPCHDLVWQAVSVGDLAYVQNPSSPGMPQVC